MKLWQKNNKTPNKQIERFTVGKDRELDLLLAEYDVLGSMAHATMLETIGLLTKEELKKIHKELKSIYGDIKKGNFKIEVGVEDVHSQVEFLLTKRIGEAGKKIHSGRSRNDQVLVDIKLFIRSEIEKTVLNLNKLFIQLIQLSNKHKNTFLPGYTHLQLAMPSSFGLWFGAYAESLSDDMELMLAAYKVANKNPLGSAAGYGSSFPLNRTLTTQLLGFETLNYNVVYAQMGRGKTEKTVAFALAAVAATLGKLAMDVTLYMNQNFGFVSFPDNLTTGSSIMPHKKNPDVFELIRAKCSKLQSLPNEITLLINNLPSGYHRDLQLIKESVFPAFSELNSCMETTMLMLKNIKIKKDILKDPRYKYLFTVESVNAEVLKGIPFREAYKKIGLQVEKGTYKAPSAIKHTHEGSMGNLCNDKITEQMKKKISEFRFKEIKTAINNLLH